MGHSWPAHTCARSTHAPYLHQCAAAGVTKLTLVSHSFASTRQPKRLTFVALPPQKPLHHTSCKYFPIICHSALMRRCGPHLASAHVRKVHSCTTVAPVRRSRSHEAHTHFTFLCYHLATKTTDLTLAAPETATSHLMQIFSAQLPDDRPLPTWQQPSVHLCTKLVVPDQRSQQNSKPRPKQEPVITARMHDAGAPQITSHHQVHLHHNAFEM